MMKKKKEKFENEWRMEEEKFPGNTGTPHFCGWEAKEEGAKADSFC